MTRIAILGIPEPTTTARYFERAARAMGLDLVAPVDLADASLVRSLDCLIVIDPYFARPAMLRDLPCPSVGYFIDVHQELQTRLAYARYVDHAIIAQRDHLDSFTALPHPSVHWLPLACDRDVHFVAAAERPCDVAFVGKYGLEGSDRFETLSFVLPHFSTNDTRRTYAPREMGQVYSRAKIVLNKSINGDLNMRFFEALASGALLVTDRIGNGLDDIGRAGEHFVTYADAKDAVDRIRYYLAHDREREAIAQRGQHLAFERHTYAHRLSAMLALIAQAEGARHAPARTAAATTETLWRSECLKLRGAPAREVLSLISGGGLSRDALANAATALARGIVRPLRQRLAARSAGR